METQKYATEKDLEQLGFLRMHNNTMVLIDIQGDAIVDVLTATRMFDYKCEPLIGWQISNTSLTEYFETVDEIKQFLAI
jgi:hypothetical protein